MKLRKIWLLLTFLTLVVGPPILGFYIQHSRNPELYDSELESAEKLLAKGNEEGALSVYEFLISHDMDDNGIAMASYSSIIARQNQVTAKASRLVKGIFGGFVFGEVKDPESLVGCVAGDLTAWGDVRDLMKSAYVKATGGEVDEFTTALAGLGLATTLAPHVDIGLSMLKNMAKFMSKSLRAGLKMLIDQAAATRKMDAITGFLNSFGLAYRQIGMGTLDLIQFSSDSKTMIRLTDMVNNFGRPAYGALMVGGKRTVQLFETAAEYGLKLSGSAGKSIIRFGVRYPQMAVRFIKIGKKVGIDNLDVTLVAMSELLLLLSWHTLAGLGFVLWLWCFWPEAIILLLNSLRRQPELKTA